MATIAHSVLTGSELHEPKGVAAATQNSIYVANASTGGAWLMPIPVGIILAYTSSTTPPALWLDCDGSVISRTTYALLFAALGDGAGVPFGVGDGSTTFKLPDLQGRVIAGHEDTGAVLLDAGTTSLDGTTLGDTGGAETHALLEAELASHRHLCVADESDQAEDPDLLSSNPIRKGNPQGESNQRSYELFGADTASPTLGQTSLTGSGTAHVVVQPTIILNYIIYAGV